GSWLNFVYGRRTLSPKSQHSAKQPANSSSVSLELCVGMICGTIPALRPLFTYYNKPRAQQGHYKETESPFKLTPYGHGLSKAPARALTSTISAGKTKHHFVATSTSEERIMATQDLGHIRRTFEIEINNEAVGSADEGRGNHNHNWNPV
ncbi:MAG: hypothetical protein M1830_006360, partial [Pleopsidium flavum]